MNKQIICPICRKKEFLVNKNLNYTFFCKNTGTGCFKNVAKICYKCHSILDPNIDSCPHCKTWLPNLPTSWIRSATRVGLLKDILDVFAGTIQDQATISQFAEVLATNNIIKVNLDKISSDPKYFQGTVVRRASEYYRILESLGFFETVETNPLKFRITQIGRLLHESTDIESFLAIIIDRIMKLKIKNPFISYSANTYDSYRIRPFNNILRIIRELNNTKEGASLPHVCLSVMCNNEDNDIQNVIKYSQVYRPKFVYDSFFSNSKEYKRSFKGVFISWLKEARIISESRGKLTLSELGKSISKYYEKYTPLWYDDLKIDYCIDILLWRLYKYDLVEAKLIDHDMINKILGSKDDFDFDFYLDIPNDKKDLVFNKLKLVLGMSDDELTTVLSSLSVCDFGNIKEVIKTNSKDIKLLMLNEKLKSGEELENEVQNIFAGKGFNCKKYSELRCFEHITLPSEITVSLPGGTRHNPDLIVENPVLLIDPKSNANQEMHKIVAYNGYAKYPGVDGIAIIITRTPLNNKNKKIVAKLDRVRVISLDDIKSMEKEKIKNFFRYV